LSLRNVGSGLAVLDSWHVVVNSEPTEQNLDHAPLGEFRRLTRDLFIPPGDIFFWQGALRDPTDPVVEEISRAVKDESALIIELLYGDEEGGQRTITRFRVLAHRTDADELIWLSTVSRHWNIDRADPR
jgi:hypothetical protein